jgi:ketosteroid isomerase-like protein
MMIPVDRAVAVDVVRDAYRLIEDVQVGRRDDYEDAYPETFAESFELLLPPSYPEGEQVFRGREGLKRWIGSIREIWDEWRMEPERFLPADDRVVVLIRIIARGHLSGVELDRETAHIWTVADGRVTRCEVYFDRSEALGR